jgi:hypothetical protein
MHKRVRLLAIIVLPLCLGIAQGGKWSRTGDMLRWTMGYSSSGLTDGRVVIIGGTGDDNHYQVFDPATGLWFRNSMSTTDDHTCALLLPNGKVMHVTQSGSILLYDPVNDNWNTSTASAFCTSKKTYLTLLRDGNVLMITDGASCQLYSHTGDNLTSTGNLSTSFPYGAKALLPSGKVLITSHTDAAIYDPVAGSWAATGSMALSRNFHQAILLPPPWSKVLTCGGQFPLDECELFDPLAGTWARTGDLNFGERVLSEMALLPSGEVLLISSDPENSGSAAAAPKCELYDPNTESWSVTDNFVPPISTFGAATHVSAFILQTGKVLLGGCGRGVCMNPPKGTIIYDPSEGVWTPRRSLAGHRARHTVTPLPIIHTTNCSTNVLVTGGEGPSGVLKSCELYNYGDNRTKVTGSLNVGRTQHTAVLLVSGEVLAAGGGPAALKSCELYNVNTEAWTPTTGEMADARFDHTATLLPDGRVLVTGGEGSTACLTSCEVYSGGTWSGAGDMTTQRARHSAVLLLDGRVMVIGGYTPGGTTNSCEIWNGSTWAAAPSMSTPRFFHTAQLLQSGRVLVTGGRGDSPTALASCEVYDPVTDAWTHEADLNEARFSHNSTLLYSGLVLVTGGSNGSSYTASCEMWDPAAEWDTVTNTHRWKTTASLASARGYHASVLVPDVHPYVLAIGGENSGGKLQTIEEYDVGLEYVSDWQPTITSHQAVTHISTSMNVQGTLFRGVSEGDAGNYTHVASNDHPVISAVRIGGGNWQGNGGGGIMYVPSSHSWDATHTDVDFPADAPSGYYRLWSIVNGIPCRWYEECAGVEEETNSQLPTRVNGQAGNGQLSVYPNPATTRSGVSFHLSAFDSRILSLEIYDLTGRSVRSLPIHDSRFTIHELNPGIYFYRVCHSELGSESRVIGGKFTVVK